MADSRGEPLPVHPGLRELGLRRRPRADLRRARRRGDLGHVVRARAGDGELLEDADGKRAGRRPRGSADWRHGSELAKSYGPDLVVTDFDGFSYLFAKSHRKPVLSVDNIQMVDRCKHDAEILRGIQLDYRGARAFIQAKLPQASHYVITTFFRPPIRNKRTTLVPSLLRPEILAARPERGDHLLVYGRISETAIAALEASGVPCQFYGARDGLTGEARERNLSYQPFANAAFIDDLRTARGVVGSAGYSLTSEAVYLRKPMLAQPIAGQSNRR